MAMSKNSLKPVGYKPQTLLKEIINTQSLNHT